MDYIFNVIRIVLVLEHEREQERNHECIARKRQPNVVPVAYAVVGEELVNDNATDHSAKESAHTVRHHHEQALRARADGRIGGCFYEK